MVCALDHAATTATGATTGESVADGDWMDALAPAPEAEGDATRRFGRYELLEEIGRGGGGVVYRARQPAPARIVALKVMLPQASLSRGLIERFRAESEAIASLDHPHILPVYDAGECDGRPFFAMKFAEGGSLSARTTAYSGRTRDIVRLVVGIARGVDHAHRRGILHRDLKPANILLDHAGAPYVADFGIAKLLDRSSALTVTGQPLGTPEYMAPEQASGESSGLTVAVDIYGLGAILYELLVQRPPFTGVSPVEVMREVASAPPPAPRSVRPEISRDLETICLKCLEKDPAQRYATAEDLAADLERWLEGRPVHARPAPAAERMVRWARRNPLLAALSVLLLALLVAVAVGSTLAARRLDSARREATVQLRASLLAQARAARVSGAAGARRGALAALAEAARIQPGLDLRNEAIAALTLLDAEVEQAWEPGITFPAMFVFDPGLETVLVEKEPGLLVRQPVGGGREAGRFVPEGPAVPVLTLPVFPADGRYVAMRTADSVVRVWDRAGSRVLFSLPGRPLPLAANIAKRAFDIAFNAEGNRIAVGLPGGGFSLHLVPDGAELGRWASDTVPAIIRYAPDGARIAVVMRNSDRLHVLNAETLATERVIALPSVPTVLTWSPGSDQIACGMRNSRIQLISPATGALVDTLAIYETGGVGDIAYHPFAPIIAANGGDEILRFWDLRSSRPILTIDEVVNNPVLAFDPKGERLGVYSNTTRRAGLVRLRFPDVFASAVPPRPVRSSISAGALDVAADGRRFVTSQHGAVQLRDGRSGASLATIAGAGTGDMMTAQFSAEGHTLFVCSQKKGLTRHALEAGLGGAVSVDPGEVLDPEEDFSVMRVSRDGRVLLFSERQSVIKVIDPSDPARPVRWSAGKVSDVIFSADEKSVLTSAAERVAGEAQVRVWEIATQREAKGFGEDYGGRADVSAQGGWILALGDNSTRLWRSGLWTPGPVLPEQLQGESHRAKLSPDGKMIVIEKSGRLHLVRTMDGAEFAVLEAPAPAGICVNECFSADGTRLYTLWQYGSVHVWDLTALRRELSELGLSW